MTTHHHSTKPFHFRLSIVWNAELDDVGREACWDALTIWCTQRRAYLGGTPSCACIVAIPASPRLTKHLERLLAAQHGIAGFEVLPFALEAGAWAAIGGSADPTQVLTPQQLSALLEALGNYQQHLVESFQQCIDVLPRLSQSLRVWHTGS